MFRRFSHVSCRTFALVTFALAALSSAGSARGDEPGLADLDEATQLKLAAKTFDDLEKVVDLSEKAIEKGISDDNKTFALRLITSSLLQRATVASDAIFRRSPPDPRWPQLRRLAMNDLDRALKNDPQFAPAHLLIGKLQSLPGGDREKAAKALAEAIRLAKDDEFKSEAHLARTGFETDPEKQLADYNEAVKLAPQSAAAIRGRGLHYFAQGKNEEALADLDAALALEPDNVATHEARGVTLMMMKRLDDAIGAFDKGLEIAPKSADLYTNRARAYALQEKFDKALADLDEALDINDNELSALLLRARVYQIQDEFDKAMEDVSRVLRLRPGLIAGLELRAGLYAAQGKFKEAIEDLELLANEDPKDKDRLLQLGVIYNAAQRPRKAIETFERVLALDENDWSALYGRADARLSIGQHAEAIADYEAALKQQPRHSGILNNLAWVLATSPKDELRNAERSIELGLLACEVTEFQKPHIISTLAAGYAEAGNWEKAIEWSKKAVEMCDDENRPQLEAELKSYQEKKPWRELQNLGEAEGEDAKPGDAKPDEPKNDKDENDKKPEATEPDEEGNEK